jgi:hypothetical protein
VLILSSVILGLSSWSRGGKELRLKIPCNDLCADTELCDSWIKFVITGRQRASAENSCNIIMPQPTSTKGHPEVWKLILQLKHERVPLLSVCVTTLAAKVVILLDELWQDCCEKRMHQMKSLNRWRMNFKMPYFKLLKNKNKSPHSKQYALIMSRVIQSW